MAYNLARALPFSQNPSVTNLIGFRPGESVGNWRDSNEGLGFGFYPFDANAALVPASLRATQALLNAGLVSNIGTSAIEVGRVADIWETHAPLLFTVTVDAATSESRLKEFIKETNLSDTLLTRPQATLNDGKDLLYYALSLKDDGTPVEVMNSDMGFNLIYGSNVSQEFLQRVIDALQPYPRGNLTFCDEKLEAETSCCIIGLLTNVGMVVSNPAYSSNRSIVNVLDRTAYHGTVVWYATWALYHSPYNGN